jgi:hypothetical protein
MSILDNRKPFEIELCLHLKFAASYLDIMESTGTRRQMLQGAYSQELDQWCIKRIQEILEKCQKLIDENDPLSDNTLYIIAPSLERLHQSALFGNVLNVKTKQENQ